MQANTMQGLAIYYFNKYHGAFTKDVSMVLDLFDPLLFVSNFILYNLEILLSNVSIS